VTTTIEIHLFPTVRFDLVDRLLVFDQRFGSTGNALICPVFALKKAP
jgi:hypothetical protein